jgi:hypothetical protein
MRFSVELPQSCDPTNISEHAKIIEKYGFYRIWIRDMIIAPWELWTALSTVVLSTSKIRVGIDVANPYTRSPVVMAHAAVTMDRISKGRLDLGFGGGIARLLKGMGIEKEEGALKECVQIVRSLLGGNSTTFTGKTFKINEMKLPVLPLSKNIPIFIAAMDEKGFRIGGEISDGVLTVSANARFLEKAFQWTKRGDDVIPLSTWLPFSLSKENLSTYLQMLASNFPMEFWALVEADKDGLSSDELIDILAICGEEDLGNKIERLENLGVAEIIFEYFNLDELEALKSLLKNHF